MLNSAFWSPLAGRELDTTPLSNRSTVSRVVACLNVWNDKAALERSVPTWKSYVDHVIVVDGSYDAISHSLSTDGTREFLLQQFNSIEIIDAPGLAQCDKRTKYCERGQEGDYLFIIDADEHVQDASMLMNIPPCDIGWIRMQNAIYNREYGQPRIIRWRPGLRYAGRHHWIYCDDSLLCTHQYGGPGFAHRPIGLTIVNRRNIGRSSERRQIKNTHRRVQTSVELAHMAMPRSAMSDAKSTARECLWILNYAYRDDGIAPSRFHTAINRTTPHASLFFKQRPGPFGVTTQFDARKDARLLQRAITMADIVHLHTVVSMALPITRAVPLVFHHHGSILRANAEKYLHEAKRRHALVLVSNLELLSWTGDYPAFFLPNVVPVARYRALADLQVGRFDATRVFRICHSPTKAERKGTQQFLAACANLTKRGFSVEPVLIENRSHADTLAIKSTCHAAFDSFWLGIQCSGLEAAAMGMPVIAGDPTVADRYRTYFGAVPYTFANSQEELEHELQRLIEDQIYRAQEAARVGAYVTANHDESAVALTYLDYLDRAFHWRDQRRSNHSLISHSDLRQMVHS